MDMFSRLPTKAVRCKGSDVGASLLGVVFTHTWRLVDFNGTKLMGKEYSE